jgi:DNA-binding response OmpR family regulator
MGATIMLCDDDSDYSDTVSALLEKEGYAVTRAADVMELSHALEEGEPADLYILDMDMPGGGGQAAAELLRANPSTEDKPILISSGVAAVEQEGWFQNLSRIRYLQKPAPPQTLLAVIKGGLRG